MGACASWLPTRAAASSLKGQVMSGPGRIPPRSPPAAGRLPPLHERWIVPMVTTQPLPKKRPYGNAALCEGGDGAHDWERLWAQIC